MGILLPKKRVNHNKCSFATKQRMFEVFAINEILSRKPLPRFPHFMPPWRRSFFSKTENESNPNLMVPPAKKGKSEKEEDFNNFLKTTF